MPTTLIGLILFVVVLLPGFIFLAVLSWDRPRRRLTAMQETAGFVLASVTINVITVTGYLVTRRLIPVVEASVDLDTLVRQIGTEQVGAVARLHYQQLWATFVVLLFASCTLAVGGGLLARQLPVRPAVMSSWWALFDHRNPGTKKTIQCHLQDSSCIEGRLGDWNTDEDEKADRDLVLLAPIKYRPPGHTEMFSHPVSAVCIAARDIVAMFVTYVPGAAASPGPAEPPGQVAAEREPPAEVEAVAAGKSAPRPQISDPAGTQDPPASAPCSMQGLASAPGYDRTRQPPDQVGHTPGPSARPPGLQLPRSVPQQQPMATASRKVHR
jgi:hypothetical protein